MAKLTIDENGYFVVDGQKLEPGAIIRRYDRYAPGWFEGEVGQISSWDFERQQRVYGLALIIDGFAPSPLYLGDTIEIVSTQNSDDHKLRPE